MPLGTACGFRYEESMKSHTARKSSFTLPPAEHAQVLRLRRLLKARSNTEVIRRSLRLLEESVSREALRRQFREASVRVRSSTLEAIRELDPLVGEGLEDA
jgi:Arc/MetJ-type ribon-helix-helix transcriptional regulator